MISSVFPAVCTAETAISCFCAIIIFCNAKWQEDPLCKTGTFCQFYSLVFLCIIGQLYENVTFIVREELVTVNDANCII